MESLESSPSVGIQSSPNLPYNVLHRVLRLLPIKTLFRLRCVCKLWRSLPFSLLFAETVSASCPMQQRHVWFFAFRLLARKVNESRVSTYKSTMYSYSIAYDREILGSSGYDALELSLGAGSDRSRQNGYGVLCNSASAVSSLESGIIDIIASTNGLLLFTLRMSKVHDHEENNLKLFVYNPLSKDIRDLPSTRYAPQKLSIIPCRDGDGSSGYRVCSLGRSYRPGTKYLLYSLEVFDSAQAQYGWQFMSHVRANLGGSGDLHPGMEMEIMGYINSKAIANALGFLYWMPSFEHLSATGRHAELSSCHLATGFYYRIPGLPFKTTFACIGLFLVCGVAKGNDVSCTCGVEIWELLQVEEGPVKDEDFYGGRCPPQGTQWQCFDRMKCDLWDRLTCQGVHRVACVVSSPFVFVIAETEEEHMVVFDTKNKTWKLTACWPSLQMLFEDKHPDYFQVYPWIVAFMPDASTLV